MVKRNGHVHTDKVNIPCLRLLITPFESLVTNKNLSGIILSKMTNLF